MNKRSWTLAGALVVAGLAFAGWLGLHRKNVRLRQEIAAAEAQAAQAGRWENDNRRMNALLEQMRSDESGAAGAVRAAVEQARQEVAELERHAEALREEKLARDRATREALAENRDLLKGPVLLENCANAGRATAVSAFETLVWASVHGDDELVAGMIVLDGPSRTLVEAFLASLPEAARQKYPTPEKLAALVLADTFTDLSAVQIVSQKTLGPARTVLTLGRLSGKTTDLVMELGPAGWQVATGDRKIFEQFVTKIAGGGVAKGAAR
jgi:hypothetical protein